LKAQKREAVFRANQSDVRLSASRRFDFIMLLDAKERWRLNKMAGRKKTDEPLTNATEAQELNAGQILVAFEKLFGGGRGVQRFKRSQLRYVPLTGGAVLIEQNPQKQSAWAKLARDGHRIAWVMRDGEYLARVVDGEVTMIVKSE
jgi:hypothetical protein